LYPCSNKIRRPENLLSQKAEKRQLTQENFESFLRWLDPVMEKAAEEYEKLRFRLITFFSHRNCHFPEDLSDETINRVVLKIDEERIENKLAYFYGVARNVYLESLRKEKMHVNVDDIDPAAPPPGEPVFSDDCLNKCLAELPEENRALILDYYSEDKQAKIDLHKKLSEGLKTSQTALRMKIVRIKQRLKGCLTECMA
jgi:DNA-directed RNA polymerase specialized sigma24 family protein